MIDRSMDELMWLLADEGDHVAVEAFIKRHPENRAELIRRVNMVREMRGSKRAGRRGRAFTPSESVRDLPAPDRRLMFSVAATVALFSIVLGTWTVNRVQSQPDKTAAVATVATADSAEVATPAPEFDPNMNVVPRVPPAPPPPPLHQSPVTVEFESIELILLFSEISRQTGLRIEIGPGMPNPNVNVGYYDVPAKSVLKDLGFKVGFTVFEQGPTHVLIIPARQEPAEEQPQLEPAQPQGPEPRSADRQDLPMVTRP